MNKIRKPGEHPGKGRVPGVRPISTKETRNKQKMERMMTDTPSFISERLRKIEENYSNSMNVFGVVKEIKEAAFTQAESSVAQVNNSKDDVEKIKILHQCVLSILDTLDLAEQRLSMIKLKYQHETELLKSMYSELDVVEVILDDQNLVECAEESGEPENESDPDENIEEEAVE